MEHTFLLLVAFIFSSGQCLDTDPSRDPGASLAICQPDSCALISELSAMRERLAAVARTQDGLLESVRSLRTEMAASQTELGVCSTQIQELQRLTQELAQQLKALQESTSAAVPRVAFTVALGHSLSPVSINTVVKYPVIISNMGNGYNPATGIFTARVPGMYYFSYTMQSNAGPTNAVISLMKNGQQMVSTLDTDQDDTTDSATNTAVLQLQAGDSVYTQLYAHRQLFDDGMYYNTFSGFLLFPL